MLCLDGTEEERATLANAFALIARLLPEYGRLVLDVTRQVSLHRGDHPNFVRLLAAHGAVFLNTPEAPQVPFFVEDLAHQCGHMIFSAATHERERWFAVDHQTPMSVYNNLRPADDRSVYVVLHGVFTEAAMIDLLDRLLE